MTAGYQTANTEPQSLSSTTKWFNDHQQGRYNIYVYCVNNNVVAWCLFSPYYNREATSHTSEISKYIHKDFQGRDIGSVLIEFLLKKAPTLNFEVLFATVICANKHSVALLKKYGFSLWGKVKYSVKYANQRFDILYYGKDIRSHNK
ncbi:GNAT family N-acetyltransferase [Lentisphaerota bacterium WC36G]|nr:GNAT family N-acetyltransferase [Lentisphaerae bacterium WC36]